MIDLNVWNNFFDNIDMKHYSQKQRDLIIMLNTSIGYLNEVLDFADNKNINTVDRDSLKQARLKLTELQQWGYKAFLDINYLKKD